MPINLPILFPFVIALPTQPVLSHIHQLPHAFAEHLEGGDQFSVSVCEHRVFDRRGVHSGCEGASDRDKSVGLRWQGRVKESLMRFEKVVIRLMRCSMSICEGEKLWGIHSAVHRMSQEKRGCVLIL